MCTGHSLHRFLPEEPVLDDHKCEVRGRVEELQCAAGGVDDRFASTIERGIDEKRRPDRSTDTQEEIVQPRIAAPLHGLRARRAIDVRDGRKLIDHPRLQPWRKAHVR